MADDTVTIQLTTEARRTLDAWKAFSESIREVKGALGGVKVETKAIAEDEGLGHSLAEGFKAAATDIIGFGTAVGTALKVVELLKEEYAEMLDRQAGAGEQQVAVAKAQRAALRNLGQGDLTPKELESTVREIQSDTGAGQQPLYEAASGVLSARGKFSASESMQQLAATAKLDPSMAAEELKTLAGAALDIRKAFGGTSEQALGGMLASQQTSRIEETGQFGTSAVPAMRNLGAYGDSFREASALFATMTQETADKMGDRSGTAVVQLAKQVQTATASIKELEGAGTAKRLEWLTSGAPEAEPIRQKMLGSIDAEAREQGVDVKGRLTGEAKQFATMVGLLTPGSETRKAYAETFRQTPDLERGEDVYSANLKAQTQVGGQTTAKVAEISSSAVETIKSDELEGLVGKTREGLAKLLKELGPFGRGSIAQKLPIFGEMGVLGPFESGGSANPVLNAKAVAEARLKRATESGEAGDAANAEKLEALKSFIAKLDELTPQANAVAGGKDYTSKAYQAAVKTAIDLTRGRYRDLESRETVRDEVIRGLQEGRIKHTEEAVRDAFAAGAKQSSGSARTGIRDDRTATKKTPAGAARPEAVNDGVAVKKSPASIIADARAAAKKLAAMREADEAMDHEAVQTRGMLRAGQERTEFDQREARKNAKRERAIEDQTTVVADLAAAAEALRVGAESQARQQKANEATAKDQAAAAKALKAGAEAAARERRGTSRPAI